MIHFLKLIFLYSNIIVALLSLVWFAGAINAVFIPRFHREFAFTHFLHFASEKLIAVINLFFQPVTHLPLIILK